MQAVYRNQTKNYELLSMSPKNQDGLDFILIFTINFNYFDKIIKSHFTVNYLNIDRCVNIFKW